MTPEEFEADLKVLGWKQSDFCRMTDLDKNTPSRWKNERTAIPGWVPSYLGMAKKVKELANLIDPAKQAPTKESDGH